MTKTLLTTTSLASCLLASPLWADLKAGDVLQHFNSAYAMAGWQPMTGTPQITENSLTILDAEMVATQPDVEIIAQFGEVRFEEQGDGTVSVHGLYDADLLITFQSDGANIPIKLQIAATGDQLVASGSPEDLTLNFSAERMELRLDEVDGLPEDTNVEFEMVVGPNTGSTRTQKGEIDRTTYQFSASGIDMVMAASAPDEGATAATGSFKDIVFAGSYEVPASYVATDDPLAVFTTPGLTQNAVISHGGTAWTLNFAFGDDSFKGSLSAGAGKTVFETREGAFSYDGETNDVALMFETGDFPVPVNLTLGQSAINMAMPLLASETDQPFQFGFGLIDFALDPMLWAMFDPQEVLPREPATVALDLSGMGRWFVDIIDEEVLMEIEGEAPGEVSALSLNDLNVSVAGAQLIGKGDLTLDNADLTTIPGFPRPEGQVTLDLSGGNGLLDKLIEMGVLSQEDAFGARMMMGLFTVPGEAEDTLTSTIEATADGQILANGQRLR